MNDLASAVVRLAEDLTSKRRRRIIDPLVLSLHRLVAQRFRKQRSWLDQHGAVDGFHWGAFQNQYDRLVSKARDAGAEIANAQLDTDIELPPAARTAAHLESELDRTTSERISSKIRDAIERGRTRDEMERELRGMFTEWAADQETSRSGATAINEISSAFNAAVLATAKAAGASAKKEWWADPEACDICLDNVGDVLELDEPFSSGDDAPPAHPNCRCSLRLITQ